MILSGSNRGVSVVAVIGESGQGSCVMAGTRPTEVIWRFGQNHPHGFRKGQEEPLPWWHLRRCCFSRLGHSGTPLAWVGSCIHMNVTHSAVRSAPSGMNAASFVS